MKISVVSFILVCALLLGGCAGLSIFSGAEREFDQGLAFFNTGNYESARPHFLRAIELEPEHAKAHLYLGRTCLNLGQWEQAIQPLRIAYRLSPTETRKEAMTFLIDALFGASLSEIKAGHFLIAIGYLRDALNMDPESIKIRSQLTEALISYGEKLLSQRNASQAIENFKNAVALTPNEIDAYFGLARAFLQKGDFYNAVSNANQVQKLDPENNMVEPLLFQILKRQ